MKIQLLDIEFYDDKNRFLPPSPLLCQEVEVVESWLSYSTKIKGEATLVPSQVFWVEGVEYLDLFSENLLIVFRETDSGKIILSGRLTSNAPRPLNVSDILFEVL